MTLDLASLALGVVATACVAAAYQAGYQRAVRASRRIWRHRGNLDLVFFEDAERDPTIERPKPASADLREFHRESQR